MSGVNRLIISEHPDNPDALMKAMSPESIANYDCDPEEMESSAHEKAEHASYAEKPGK